jgi:hypothetical protein
LSNEPNGRPDLAFSVALAGASFIPVAIAFDARSDPTFAITLFLLNMLPIAAALLLYRVKGIAAGWGWLAGVFAFASYVWYVTTQGNQEGSTASLAFLWLPIWSCAAPGPIGALIGWLLGRKFIV